MSCSHLHIELQGVTEEGRAWTKLKMVNLNHIMHKPVRSNTSPLIRKLGKHTNLKNWRWVWWGGCGMWYIRSADPHNPLLTSISRTGRDTTTSRLLATWMSLSPTLQVRPLSQRGTTSSWHRTLWNNETEPSLWPGFATSLRKKRLRQAYGGLLLNLCQRPVYMAIKASLTRRNHILETMKKGELWSLDLMMLPGSRIKYMC